jgi:hypothetical protein
LIQVGAIGQLQPGKQKVAEIGSDATLVVKLEAGFCSMSCNISQPCEDHITPGGAVQGKNTLNRRFIKPTQAYHELWRVVVRWLVVGCGGAGEKRRWGRRGQASGVDPTGAPQASRQGVFSFFNTTTYEVNGFQFWAKRKGDYS